MYMRIIGRGMGLHCTLVESCSCFSRLESLGTHILGKDIDVAFKCNSIQLHAISAMIEVCIKLTFCLVCFSLA